MRRSKMAFLTRNFRIFWRFTALLSFTASGGCSSPADELSNHLHELSLVAMESAAQCERMARDLNAYLDEHGADIRAAAVRLDSANAEDARALFKSSSQLEFATEYCSDETMARFRSRLADCLFINLDDK